MKKYLNHLLLISFVLIFLFCTYQIIQRIISIQTYNAQNKVIAEILNNEMIDSEKLKDYMTDIEIITVLEDNSERMNIFLSYEELVATNEDYIGWISIPETPINYPVLQNKNDFEYYLRHNFERKNSVYGSIYMDSACTLDTSKNYILYGHHMKDGSMFASIEKYLSEAYYIEHPIIFYDTPAGLGNYQVIAAFKAPFHDLDFLATLCLMNNLSSFNQFFSYVESNKLYDTGISYEYSDSFLTLMTCDYSTKNGRMFIIAKKTAHIT